MWVQINYFLKQTMDYKKLVVVFVVTAAWDVVLRLFAEKRLTLLGIENLSWVRTLEAYFEKHTVLAAALLAGFAGVMASLLIDSVRVKSRAAYVAWVAIASALVGIPMRYTEMFPHLVEHYYKPLPVTTIFSDALSGVVVMLSMYALGL